MTKPERSPNDEIRRLTGCMEYSGFGFRIFFVIRHSSFGFPRLWLLAVLALCASGCAGYRLGPVSGLSAGEKSVQIVPFSNQTLEPRLGDAVTYQLRKELQK